MPAALLTMAVRINVLLQVLLFLHQWQVAPFWLLPWPNHLTLTSVNVWADQMVTLVPVSLRVGGQQTHSRLTPFGQTMPSTSPTGNQTELNDTNSSDLRLCMNVSVCMCDLWILFCMDVIF